LQTHIVPQGEQALSWQHTTFNSPWLRSSLAEEPHENGVGTYAENTRQNDEYTLGPGVHHPATTIAITSFDGSTTGEIGQGERKWWGGGERTVCKRDSTVNSRARANFKNLRFVKNSL
jgi:hypothetical protein